MVTAVQARDGYDLFKAKFPGALTRQVPHYYAIAASDSLTTAEEFTRHCEKLGLRATPRYESMFVPGMVEEYFEADEGFYDAFLLRQACRKMLQEAGVLVLTRWRAAKLAAREHDITVVTAYAELNETLRSLNLPPVTLQYETCEVAVIRAPTLVRRSVVFMDGPFMSFAPYAPGLHLLYDVEHTVHRRTIGTSDIAPAPLRTNFPRMLSSLQRFTGVLPDARLVESLCATRVVLPDVDATDARQYQMQWTDPRVLAVLGGKVSASVSAAREVAAEVAAKLEVPCPAR